MRLSVKNIVAVVVLLASAALSYEAYLFLYRDPDREALEALIAEVAACTGKCEAEDYARFVDLDEFGFRLEYWGQTYSYGKAAEKAFIEKARYWTPLHEGSQVRIVKSEIEINSPTASASVTAHWRKGSGRASAPEAALIGCEFKFARGAAGWKISSAALYPARDFLLKR